MPVTKVSLLETFDCIGLLTFSLISGFKFECFFITLNDSKAKVSCIYIFLISFVMIVITDQGYSHY